jgi:uncharacterized coiled-coil protein SlyX
VRQSKNTGTSMGLDLPSALAILSVVLASGAVPLFIYLFSRRAQLRQLNTSSDASIVTSAAALIAQLQQQILVLTEKLARQEGEAIADRANFMAQLNRAHGENSRVSAMVAQLQTDLDITHRQIEELRARLPRTGPSS